MLCSEYKRLLSKHERALKWVERYAQPEKYGITVLQGRTLQLLLSLAREKEFDFRLRMEMHRETCETCRAEHDRYERKVS